MKPVMVSLFVALVVIGGTSGLAPVLAQQGSDLTASDTLAQGDTQAQAGPPIVLSTISQYVQDGNISRMENRTETVRDVEGLRALLTEQTAAEQEYGMNTTGIVVNQATDTVLVTHGRDRSNDAAVNEFTRAINVSQTEAARCVCGYGYWVYGNGWSYHEIVIVVVQ
jgi:hypothetical protein